MKERAAVASLPEQCSLLTATLDAVGASVCVLDSAGTIVWVNEPWSTCTRMNGGDPQRCGVGVDYFAACTGAPDAFVADLRAVLRGQREQVTYDYPCHSPTVRRWFHAQVRTFVVQGERFAVAVHQDITARVLAARERASIAANLHRLQCIESAGTMVSGLAHDFRNVLTAMLGGVELLRRAPAPQQRDELLTEIEHAGQHAGRLVERIMTLGRARPTHVTAFDLGELIAEVLSMQRRLAPAGVEFTRQGLDALSVEADRAHLHQVLTNLATNAWQAAESGRGLVEFRLTRTVLKATDAARLPGIEPGEFARLDVRDHGRGMDRATMARLFEPFFSTKEPQPGELGGCGLGLAISLSLVRAHGGGIQVESAPGRGATFSVYVPLQRRAANAAWTEPELGGS